MSSRRPVDFRLAAERFDPKWYRHAHPDIEAALSGGETALGHYVEFGDREGRPPNPDFNPSWYLEHYPAVRAAIARGQIAGAFHDYLRRAGLGTPRRPGPATAIVGAMLTGADPILVATLLGLAGRAPGWEFWLLAPPGGLPPGPAGPNLRFVATEAELPGIDLWIGLGGDSVSIPAGSRAALAPLMESLGHAPADRSAAALDRVLERLRAQLLADCPVLPASRRDSGPVHVDRRRVERLRLASRTIGRPASAGGIVLRTRQRIIAEIPPPDGSAATVVDLGEPGELWVTVSGGLAVDFAAADRPDATVDVILRAGHGSGVDLWRVSVRAAAALRPALSLLLVDPPPGLELPEHAVAVPSLAAALAAHARPALLVPVGVELFPQAATQGLDALADGVDRAFAPSALRHPDGHLVPWSAGRLDHDRDHRRHWERAGVAVLSAAARQRGAPRRARAAAGTAFALGAVDATAWPVRFASQPSRAPDWLHLDCRPDGAVIGRLRLRGARLAEGGRIIVYGSMVETLAGPCEVRAETARRGAEAAVITALALPPTGGFAWPIDLPAGLRATDTIVIAPAGRWITAQGSEDPRPVLFRVEQIRYRPAGSGSSRPSASRRAR